MLLKAAKWFHFRKGSKSHRENIDAVQSAKHFGRYCATLTHHIKHATNEKMKYTTIRFDPKNPKLYRGYFPIIPNKNSHKECFEIGQWDTEQNYDSPLQV